MSFTTAQTNSLKPLHEFLPRHGRFHFPSSAAKDAGKKAGTLSLKVFF